MRSARRVMSAFAGMVLAGACSIPLARADDILSHSDRQAAVSQAASPRTDTDSVGPLDQQIPGFMQSAYGPPSFGPPYGTTHFFGDWGGVQPWLQKHGIYFALDVYESLAGNVTGGRHHTETNAGQVGSTLDIDWNRLLGGEWSRDFWLHMLVVNGHGRSLSNDIGDNVSAVQQIYGARGNVVAHLVWAYFEKSWLNNRVDWAMGWIPTGTFFNNSPWVCSFMNVSLCGNVTPTKYLNGGRDWPSGNIGTVLRLMPFRRVYVMGGLFAVSPHSYNGGISGWAWAQSGLKKLSTEVEIGWLPEWGPDKLIGHYKVGAMYDNSKYNDYYSDINGNPWVLTGLPARRQSGQTSPWVMLDQMLIRHGKGETNGMVLAGQYAYASGQTSAVRDHLVAALLDTGKAWGRPKDSWGVAFQWFNFSRSAIRQQEVSYDYGLPFQATNFGTPHGIQSHMDLYELFYTFHVMNGMTLQPDFQYINRLGGTTKYKDAAVLGLAFNMLL